MSLEVVWYDDERTILLATINKTTTWDDYHGAVEYIVAEVKLLDYRIDVIFLDNVGMPAGNPIPHLKWGIATMSKQSNLKSFYIAGSRGSSGFVRSIFEALGKAFSHRLKTPNSNFNGFTKTLDEAIRQVEIDRARTGHVLDYALDKQ